jgi:hypothetical protein
MVSLGYLTEPHTSPRSRQYLHRIPSETEVVAAHGYDMRSGKEQDSP